MRCAFHDGMVGTITVTEPTPCVPDTICPVLAVEFSASPCEGEAVTVTNLSTGVDAEQLIT